MEIIFLWISIKGISESRRHNNWYKTYNKTFEIRFICIQLHIPVFRDRHQVIYRYKSDIIMLSMRMDQFVTFTNNTVTSVFKLKY
jgi:hypothetical protein